MFETLASHRALSIIVGFASAFAVSVALTGVVRYLARRASLMDKPRGDRWHRRPVPRLGGIAIYAAFMTSLFLVQGPPNSPEMLALVVGGTIIFLVGLIDDLRPLESRMKLILLIVCAVVPATMGVRFTFFPAVLGVPLAIIWILGVTNAFNWLDNMDGVAAGVAAIATLNLVVFGLLFNGATGIPLSLALAGAALGFLVHNFPPARIFMGDSGSGFLGFTVAMIAVIGTYRDVSNVLLAVLVPAMILAVPIFDTAMVTLTRMLNRRPLFKGGRDHPAHRLVAMGLPERRAVALLYGLSTLAGASALLASLPGLLTGVTVSIILILGFVALGAVLGELQVYDDLDPARRASRTLLPKPFVNKKWIALIGLDVVLVVIAYVSAHLLRFEGYLGSSLGLMVAETLPVMLAAKMVSLAAFGVYRGSWRYAGMVDLVRLAQGASVGSLIGVAALFVWLRLAGMSRAALLIDWLLTLLFLCAARLSLRLVREYLAAQGEAGRRALIVGTGEADAVLLDLLRAHRTPTYRAVGFIDDDPTRHGAVIQGVPVVGGRRDLARLIRDHNIEEVLVMMPSFGPQTVSEILKTCRAAGVTARRFGLFPDTA
jgi:UDP-GlcNAc:undecaprenyl-phosphate/decaprenyl-phosphate GlcNAc-1-phosphate transferase